MVLFGRLEEAQGCQSVAVSGQRSTHLPFSISYSSKFANSPFRCVVSVIFVSVAAVKTVCVSTNVLLAVLYLLSSIDRHGHLL